MVLSLADANVSQAVFAGWVSVEGYVLVVAEVLWEMTYVYWWSQTENEVQFYPL